MYVVYLSHIYLSLPQCRSYLNPPIKYMPFYNYVFLPSKSKQYCLCAHMHNMGHLLGHRQASSGHTYIEKITYPLPPGASSFQQFLSQELELSVEFLTGLLLFEACVNDHCCEFMCATAMPQERVSQHPLHPSSIEFFLPPLSRCHLSLGGDSTDVSSMAMRTHITLHFEQHGDPALTTIFCTAVKSFSDKGWNSANL